MCVPRLAVAPLALLVAGCSTGSPTSSPRGASPAPRTVDVRDARGMHVGTVTLSPGAAGAGVHLHAVVEGLPPGPHGFDLYSVGRCDPPTFLTAGTRVNPSAVQGALAATGRHTAGDLPDLTVAAGGRAVADADAPLVTLDPGHPESLVGPAGSAVVIHAKPGSAVTDATADTADRIACGVVVPGTGPGVTPGSSVAAGTPAAVPPAGAKTSPPPGRPTAGVLPNPGNIPANAPPPNQAGNVPAHATAPPAVPKCIFPEPTPIPPHPTPCTP